MVFANKLLLQENHATVLNNHVEFMEFVFLKLVKFLTSFLLEKQIYHPISLLALHQVFVLQVLRLIHQMDSITA